MKRFYYFMLALMLALLPGVGWAQVGYAELAVNNSTTESPKVYGDTDATYTLTFRYGTMPSNTSLSHYWNVENTPAPLFYDNAMRIGLRWDNCDYWFAREYDYAEGDTVHYHLRYNITDAVIEPSFASARPKSCAYWFNRAYSTTQWEFASLNSLSGLEYLNTSEVTDMTCMFAGNTDLTSFNVGHFDTNKVKSFGNMFMYCSEVTSINLDNWDTSNVENFAAMFYNCTELASCNVSNWDTHNAKRMAYMFLGCRSLTSFDLHNWDTRKAEDLGGMFNGCRSVESIDISNFSMKNIKTLTGMFQNCTALISLDMSNCDVSGVKSMVKLFAGCINLATIDMTNWSTTNCVDMWLMFSGLNKLKTIKVGPGWTTENLKPYIYYRSTIPIVLESDEIPEEYSQEYYALSAAAKLTRFHDGRLTDLPASLENIIYVSNNGEEKSFEDLFGGFYEIKVGNNYYIQNGVVNNELVNANLTLTQGVAELTIDASKNIAATVDAWDGMTNVTVTLKKTYAANTLTTISLPFDMSAEEVESVFGAGTVLTQLSNATYDSFTNTYTIAHTATATGIEAGKPYFIVPAQKPTYTDGEETIDGFQLTGRTISATAGSTQLYNGVTMHAVLAGDYLNPSGYASDDNYVWGVFESNSGFTTLSPINADEVKADNLTAVFSAVEAVKVKMRNAVADSFSSTYNLDFTAAKDESGNAAPIKAYLVSQYIPDNTSTNYVGTLYLSRAYYLGGNTGAVLKGGGKNVSYTVPVTSTCGISASLMQAVSGTIHLQKHMGDYTAFTYSASKGTISVWTGNTTTSALVGRAYLAIPTASLPGTWDTSGKIRMVFDDMEEEDEVTAIEGIEEAVSKVNDGIFYNINGQRVDAPTKGFYIVNGKKVLVK